MKFGDLFRRQQISQDEFSTLEANLADALMSEVTPNERDSRVEPEPDLPVEEVRALGDAGDGKRGEEPGELGIVEAYPVQPPALAGAIELTEYSRARLAEIAAFEHMHTAAEADLDAISVRLAQVKIAHHQTREFLSGIHSSIHRANELEGANNRLSTDNRVLFRQAEYVSRLRSQQEGLVEAFKQREEKLVEAADTARNALSAVRLELVEAQAQIGSQLAELGDLRKLHAAASTQSERALRESEVLREKLANFSMDLDMTTRRRVETERKLDEMTAMRTRESADIAEMRAHLAAVESERLRLQKQHDALQHQHTEATEALKISESELLEQAKRSEVSFANLRNERDKLAARLEFSIKAEGEAADKVSALTAALNEAMARKRLAEDGAADGADPSLGGRSDQAEELARLRHEVSDLRAQLAERAAANERARRPNGAVRVERAAG